jgi:hypothetical protein
MVCRPVESRYVLCTECSMVSMANGVITSTSLPTSISSCHKQDSITHLAPSGRTIRKSTSSTTISLNPVKNGTPSTILPSLSTLNASSSGISYPITKL